MKDTRKKAIKSGEMYYYTGKPCIVGHVSKRTTVDGSCYQCRIENQKKHRGEIRSLVSLDCKNIIKSGDRNGKSLV